MILEDLFFEYGERAIESLTLDDIERLRAELPKVELSELRDKSDFKLYIELVKKFREHGVAVEKATQGVGFQAWVTNTLSVGEDGIYADGETRFLFELIQNVDDCEYDDIASANLDIQFKFAEAEIVLTYNEKGFRPIDIFNITGIAEQSKNISAEKIEIGEKGIGFKSVFGIADKVLIQSGNFSFALEKGNFKIPVPSYDEFDGQAGTRLTLYITGGEKKVENIFLRLVERYKSENSLVNENPILFLNKLTKLKMYFDGWRQIQFSMDRTKTVSTESGIEFEESITIKAEIKVNFKGHNVEHSPAIRCYKYHKDIVFSREACVSRYGESTKFEKKKMRLYLLFPHIGELDKIKQGALYSFLPTQTVTTAPLIIHAPFKLAASRDYVDSQGGNKWFTETVAVLESLLIGGYKHLATQVKESIVKYIPTKRHYSVYDCFNGVQSNKQLIEAYLFDGNDKVDCLRIEQLSRTRLLAEKLFVCADGEYRMANEVCVISTDDKVDDCVTAHHLANIPEPLFCVENTENLNKLGIKVHKGIKDKIFFRALEDSDISKEAFDFLITEKYKPNDEVLKQKIKNTKFTVETLKVLSNYDYKKEFSNAIIAITKTSFDNLPVVDETSALVELEPKHKELVNDALDEIERKIKLKEYWSKIEGRCLYCKASTAELFIPTTSFLLLFGEAPLQALEAFARSLGGSRLFEVALTTCVVSELLDKLCEDKSIDAETFFDQLKEQRGSLRRSFGTQAYAAYIKIIQDAGADKRRFIKELIQNADDCEYLDGTEPHFVIRIDGHKIVTESNERGFTRKNLRAITAIGESTKKRLFGNNADTIGEKGIGFKSVFGIAKSVLIRSCRDGERFNFSLAADTPTIPQREKAEGFEHLVGTKMEFALKDGMAVESLSMDKIIDICRCLRKLRHIEIGSIKIDIKDTDGSERIITVKDGHLSPKQIRMRIVKHGFEVNDEQAVSDRTDDYSIEVKRSQTIFVYIPDKIADNKDGRFSIYSGLPTSDTIDAPLYIDAPFDLIASRERIKKSKWNEYVAIDVLIAVAKAFATIAEKERIEVLDYLPKEGELFNGEFAQYVDADLEWALRQFKFLPTMDKGCFAAPFSEMVYYPNFVKLLLEKIEIAEIDRKKTIDFFATSDYSTERHFKILEYLGCKQANDSCILDIIEKYAWTYLSDKNIRISIFSYLKNIQQQTRQEYIYRIKQLKIVPVKAYADGNPVFVSYNEKPIWYGDSEQSTENYYILFTEWLTADDFNKVFYLTSNENTNIKEMSNAQRRAEYENKLNQFFNRSDAKKEYEWLVEELKNNRSVVVESQYWFLGNKDRIPLKTAAGDYRYAKWMFISQSNWVYSIIKSNALKHLLVDEGGHNVAELLQCDSIARVGFEDIKDTIDADGRLSQQDIDDLQNKNIVPYGIGILAQCKDWGYISDILLAQNPWISGLGGSDIDEDEYEFPTKPIANLERLNERIVRLWRDEPIRVVEKKIEITDRVGMTMEGKEISIKGDTTYAKQMYTAESDNEVCFCQLCKKPHLQKYIEVNKVEYLPGYYWEQLKLCFCLNCSKDFEMLRNNPQLGNAFIEAIINNESESENDGTVKVRIGDKQIAFTETHFAEVQQILRTMRKDKGTQNGNS